MCFPKTHFEGMNLPPSIKCVWKKEVCTYRNKLFNVCVSIYLCVYIIYIYTESHWFLVYDFWCHD